MEEDEEMTNVKPRYRSPVFNKEEVKVLLDLIEKYKAVILNKSSNNIANKAKDRIWEKIATEFNTRGFEIMRTSDVLRRKWTNLASSTRKQTKNLLDVNQDDEFNSQMFSILFGNNNKNEDITHSDFEEDSRDYISEREHQDNDNSSIDKEPEEALDKEHQDDDNNSIDKEPEESIEKVLDINTRNRSSNFSSQEIKILLQCVKAERKYVFFKGCTKKDIQMKNLAWSRITEEFNKRSPHKRSRKNLHTKFFNMRRSSSKNATKHFKETQHVKILNEDISAVPRIKREPSFEEEIDSDPMNNADSDDNFENKDFEKMDIGHKVDSDPLSTVLIGSDSGLGSSINIDAYNPFENKDVVKLKMELLSHKIENAKLKRKIIENAIEDEAKARETNAIERALRLRSARLQTIAAETQLGADHPALEYTAEEIRAQSYLKKYHT
ncbi:uncharacterized protein LOC106134963 isoform X3 [Amyelois transitella]|uniref:uncharacterized protein LOC106134963 isoform X3 n=1 Tax=Amyelois transitella TaxID=680683 RepID=UPI00299018C4|nr:uncharacterized protein LOC106134963 isoform X3 [Amyelois transitella]